MRSSQPHDISHQELTSTISTKGQITVPVKIRRHLGLGTHDHIAFIVEKNGDVKVSQVKYPTIQSMAGKAGSLKKPISYKKMKEIAYKDRFVHSYEKHT